MEEGNRGFIPQEIYRIVHQFTVIACVDTVIVNDGRVLLLRRLKDPAKGDLWFPGGRLWKDEGFAAAARRLVKEETKLQVEMKTVLGVDNLILSGDPFGHGKGTHCVAVVVRCSITGGELTLDANHSGHIWSDGSEEELHPYLQTHIKKALAQEA